MTAIATWLSSPYGCGPSIDQNFRTDFRYMTSTAEYCDWGQFNCEVTLPHWQKPIVVSILSIDSELADAERIRYITLRALGEIREVTPIQIVHESELEPNFMVFVMNDQMLARLSQNDVSSVDFSEGSLHRQAYNNQSCSARSWVTPLSEISSNEYQVALAGAIFVHHSLEGTDLESCIYEEIAGGVGLSNDPEGQPSLFTQGNYEIVDGQFRYSQRLLLMFQAIYQIASGEYADIDDFCDAQNGVIRPASLMQSMH